MEQSSEDPRLKSYVSRVKDTRPSLLGVNTAEILYVYFDNGEWQYSGFGYHSGLSGQLKYFMVREGREHSSPCFVFRDEHSIQDFLDNQAGSLELVRTFIKLVRPLGVSIVMTLDALADQARIYHRTFDLNPAFENKAGQVLNAKVEYRSNEIPMAGVFYRFAVAGKRWCFDDVIRKGSSYVKLAQSAYKEHELLKVFNRQNHDLVPCDRLILRRGANGYSFSAGLCAGTAVMVIPESLSAAPFVSWVSDEGISTSDSTHEHLMASIYDTDSLPAPEACCGEDFGGKVRRSAPMDVLASRG